MAPRLLRRLGLPSEPPYNSSLGLDSRVMMSAKDSRKTTMWCQYFEHLAPVDKLDVLVVPMTAYDIILGLPWFESRNPEIDWSKGQLLGLQTPVGNSRNQQTITSLPQGDGSAEHSVCKPPPTVNIQVLGATTFDDLLASNEVTTAFAIRIDESTGLMGASTMSEGITLEKFGETSPGRC